VAQFQRLMKAALLAGTAAGLVLFIYQQVFVVPRILAAEVYETRHESAEQGPAHHEHHEHESSEWKPAEGFERTFFTAVSTVLTGIGFAAVLLSAVSLSGVELNARRGLLWGIGGFVCFVASPALGLPPEPPGVPVADVVERQLWWIATAGATAIGLFLIVGHRRRWLFLLAGLIVLVLPHAIGAPKAIGEQVVPAVLVHEFAIASIVGNGLFWLILGSVGGFLFELDRKRSSNRQMAPARHAV
jgi:cobalt transporter subunit CbtA